MKDQYFGDINDYRKYGLLRQLAASGLETTVAWMLTPDDGSSDGRRLGYLGKPERWERFDPRLFASLKALLSAGVGRRVALVENSRILPGARFYSELVPRGEPARERWLEGLVERARGTDLVFLDPDNGLEVKSVPRSGKGATRYVYWSDVEALFRSGFSLLIYQHFPRRPRREFIAETVERLAARTGAAAVEALVTANVLFLLAAQPAHAAKLGKAMRGVSADWPEQIETGGFWRSAQPRRFEDMGWWVYFASSARAGEADTLDFALEHKVLYRPSHTEDGSSLIPNVAKLRPGDLIFLVYRRPGVVRARVLARIAVPENGVPGLKAVDRIEGDLARIMSERGYPLQADGSQEVLRLAEAEPCDLVLEGRYGGHNAIHKVDEVDRPAVRKLIR